MSRLTSEPTTSIRSIDALLAVALAMEKESADRYADLAQRMRAAGRRVLAEAFDSIVSEEIGRTDMVVGWSRKVTYKSPEILQPEAVPQDVFDEEGIGLVSPELVDAYRSLAVAARNEERAFGLWSYVAAHGVSQKVRETAERMAREELKHGKTLRRERRKAFFKVGIRGQQCRGPTICPVWKWRSARALRNMPTSTSTPTPRGTRINTGILPSRPASSPSISHRILLRPPRLSGRRRRDPWMRSASGWPTITSIQTNTCFRRPPGTGRWPWPPSLSSVSPSFAIS